MDFFLMSCPFCGRTVESSESGVHLCSVCGKIIRSSRKDLVSCVRPGGDEETFRRVLDLVGEGETAKALEAAEALVEATDGDQDAYFLRGYVNAVSGEDGRAHADWVKGLELLPDSVNIHAYICLMARGVAELIYHDQEEFISFDHLAYVEKLCDRINECAGIGVRGLFYYTLYRDCLDIVAETDTGEERHILWDVIPDIFRKTVAYNHDYLRLVMIVSEHLEQIGYSKETYEDDDYGTPHVYDLIRCEFAARLVSIEAEDRLRIFDHWTDELIKAELEPSLNELLGKRKLRDMLMPRESHPPAEEAAKAYVDRCLLAQAPAGQEPSEERPRLQM